MTTPAVNEHEKLVQDVKAALISASCVRCASRGFLTPSWPAC